MTQVINDFFIYISCGIHFADHSDFILIFVQTMNVISTIAALTLIFESCEVNGTDNDGNFGSLRGIPPTKSKESNLPSQVAPTTTAPEGCCSHDFKTCIAWCGTTEEDCDSCRHFDEYAWLPQGETADYCVSRWGTCTDNVAGCCPGLECMKMNDDWSQCVAPSKTRTE